MARTLRFQEDSSLSKPHEAGEPVTKVQPSLHETYGMVFIPWPRYWVFHLESAQRRYEKLSELDKRVLEVPVDASGSRLISDQLLVGELFEVGTEMVLHTVLSVRHLVLEIERTAGIQADPRDDLNTRLTSALKIVGHPGDLSTDPRYGQFAELLNVRDGIEHPNEDNVYNSAQGKWDLVPIAWITSGKARKSYEVSRGLIEDIVRYWEAKRKDFDRPGTLTVTRGLRSLHSAKKAPSEQQ